MKTMLVATDFSKRSDPALRWATLPAKQHDACIELHHFIDADQPKQMVEAEWTVAGQILSELRETVQAAVGFACDGPRWVSSRLALGSSSTAAT
jgi:hypothetical protein